MLAQTLLLSAFVLLSSASDTKATAWEASTDRIARRQSSGNPYTVHTIDQLIDHFPDDPRYEPHTGNKTFKQRYIFDTTYYKPGGPVYLYIGGETSLESRLSNIEQGIVKLLMQATNGLGIILENRYYGDSYPFDSSTTDELAYLTTEQTIADNAYFAQHAKVPGVKGNINAPHAPWILYGGSLAGAQTAFSVKVYGEGGEKLLYGGIAASGVVHSQLAYPRWYYPIEQFAPGDCTANIYAIIDKFDHLVTTKNRNAVQEFKEIFGLGAVKDDRDFAMTIAFPLGGPMNYPTNTWQELNWNSEYASYDFWNFCSNVTNLNPPRQIAAVDWQLAKYTNHQPWVGLGNYANYVKQVVLPHCTTGDYNSALNGCFGTQNQTFYADPTNSAARSYLYSTCTEQGMYQVAPPTGPSLISRVLQVDYTQQWCTWAFPAGKYNSVPSDGPNVTRYNQYGDFNFSAPRLAFIDGEDDVWRDVCVGSRLAPQRFEDVSGLHPRHIIGGGGHHWDSYAIDGYSGIDKEPQFIKAAHQWEVRVVRRWLASWRKRQGHWFGEPGEL